MPIFYRSRRDLFASAPVNLGITVRAVGCHARTTCVPLVRRISRRISSTLIVESTRWIGRPQAAAIASIDVGAVSIAASTCLLDFVEQQLGGLVSTVPSSRWMFLGQRAKLGQHVVDRFDEFRAVLDQRMAAARHAAIDRPRHGEHFAALLVGMAGRDQGAGAVGRLDDDRADGQPADDAVALRKRTAERHHARRRLR